MAFKRTFVKGLTVLLPFVLTLAVIYWAADFLFSVAGDPLGKLAHSLFNPSSEYTFLWRLLGFTLAIIIVFAMGLLAASVIGRYFYSRLERLLREAPLLKSLYPFMKQIAGFVLPGGSKKLEFKKPVLIPFPSSDTYSIGFVTSGDCSFLGPSDKDKVCVFVPTSPTPFSGFTVFISNKYVRELSISVEEAMRIIISCGIMMPERRENV